MFEMLDSARLGVMCPDSGRDKVEDCPQEARSSTIVVRNAPDEMMNVRLDETVA